MVESPSSLIQRFSLKTLWLAQLGQLGQDETITVCASTVGSDKGVNYFFPLTQRQGDLFFGTSFLHMNGTQRDEIKLQCSVWFESIKRLALVSAVKEYFCVHILKFYIVLNLRLNRRDKLSRESAWLQSGRSRVRFPGLDHYSGSFKNNWEWRESLCTSSGWTFAWLGWPRKMAVPSPVGDVKIVSTISTFVVNTFALKWSCKPSGPVRPRLIQHELLVVLEFDKYCNWVLWLVRHLVQCDQG